MFLLAAMSRPALGPTHSTVQWVPMALSLGVKKPGHEADHSPPSSAKVKNAWSYTSTPQVYLHGLVLKHRTTLPVIFLPLSGNRFIRGFAYLMPEWSVVQKDMEIYWSRERNLKWLLLVTLFLFYSTVDDLVEGMFLMSKVSHPCCLWCLYQVWKPCRWSS
jgi:hypothetical protein